MGYIGSHRIEEEGDVLVLTFGGDCSPEEAWQILAIIDGIIKRHGRYGALVDVRRLGRVDLETRRSIAKWPGSRNCYGNAFYGASLATRTLLTLLAQGIRMFRGHNFP